MSFNGTAKSHVESSGGGGVHEEGGLPYFAGLVLLVLALMGAFAIMPRIFRPHEAAMSGQKAPDFALKFVANVPASSAVSAGHDVPETLHGYEGKAVVLDFWATWCGPCQAQSPVLDRIASRYADRGVVVLGINTSDQPGNAEAWVKRHRISYPIAYDDGEAAKLYGVENLPTLVVLSRAGKVVAVRHGFTDTAEIESLLKRVL